MSWLLWVVLVWFIVSLLSAAVLAVLLLADRRKEREPGFRPFTTEDWTELHHN